jgi:hypothetical protein
MAGLKTAGVVLFTAAAIGLLVWRGLGWWHSGESGAGVWFYDLSEKKLYSVPGTTVPPHKGVGGKSGDGVRAIVVSLGSEPNSPRQRKVAYLETYTPELKSLLEQVLAARSSGKPSPVPVPPRDSSFFQTNTLVKRLEEPQWHTLSSPEGLKATTEWRSWRGPQGQAPTVCVP